MGTPTPLELIRLTTGFLQERGVETPRLDAEVLLAHVLGVPRIQLYIQFDRPLEKAEVDAYRELVRRRGRREPIAHLTGLREFWSLDFRVDATVLVPRPETERLVEACLERMADAGRFLDLGTGSGAIAAALLSERPGWTGVGVDCDARALAVAEGNVRNLGLADRLVLRRGDLFQGLGPERFDLMVSNPPYIPSGDIDTLQPEVRCFEPRSALDGGPDGLNVIRRLVGEAPDHLATGGCLAFEFGIGQADAVRGLLDAAGTYGNIAILDDLQGHPRVAVAGSEPRP